MKPLLGYLAFTTSESGLNELFSVRGNVIDIKLPRDHESGQPRDFAFVTMATSEGAQAAILALNGKEVGARTLTVN